MTERLEPEESSNLHDQPSEVKVKRKKEIRKKAISSERDRCNKIWKRFNCDTPSFAQMTDEEAATSLIEFLNTVAHFVDDHQGGKGDASQVRTLSQTFSAMLKARAKSPSPPVRVTPFNSEATSAILGIISTNPSPSELPTDSAGHPGGQSGAVDDLETTSVEPITPLAEQNKLSGENTHISTHDSCKASKPDDQLNLSLARRKRALQDQLTNQAELVQGARKSLERRLDGLGKNVGNIHEKTLEQIDVTERMSRRLMLLESKMDEYLKSEKVRDQRQNLLIDHLQKLQAGIDEIGQAGVARDQTMRTLEDELKHVQGRLDAKIDLGDAMQVLDLRQEIEPAVRSELIQSISKHIMPALELLKERVEGRESELVAAANDLERRCKQAGLIPLNKLF